MSGYVLTLSCNDRPGLVAEVAGQIAGSGGNIEEAAQFNDVETGRFFQRVRFKLDEQNTRGFAAAFTALATERGMQWSLRPVGQRRKVLILVSKFDHCLADLLYRMRIGELAMDVVGIVCNHPREALDFSLSATTLGGPKIRTGFLRAGDGMDFTTKVLAETALRLARGEGKPGAHTPCELFGVELATDAGAELVLR